MTTLTVDAKLMTILPAITRPDARHALVIAFGMGSSYRAALTAGLDVPVFGGLGGIGLLDELAAGHPGVEIDVHEGGQPHYPLLLAAE
jgi:hypothetical protein